MKNKDYVLPLLSITISLLVIGTVGATLAGINITLILILITMELVLEVLNFLILV